MVGVTSQESQVAGLTGVISKRDRDNHSTVVEISQLDTLSTDLGETRPWKRFSQILFKLVISLIYLVSLEAKKFLIISNG